MDWSRRSARIVVQHFFFSTVKPVLSGRHLGMAYWPLNTVKVWQKWELLKKMKVVKERIIHPTTNWRSPVSTSSWAKRKKVKDHLTPYTVRLVVLWCYVFSKWPFKLFVKGDRDRFIQASFTVIKGNYFRGFCKWPLNGDPLFKYRFDSIT